MKREFYNFTNMKKMNKTFSTGCWLLIFGLLSFATQAQLTVTLNPTHPTCGSVPNGSVSSNVSDGTGAYSYIWNNGATTPNLSNVLAGTYSLTVTDITGSTGTASITMDAPPTIGATISSNCSAPLSATANVTGGVAPFMYMWSNGENTPTITNLSPAEYCVTIMDANTCGTIVCADVGQGPNVFVTTTDTGCAGNTGTATANPSNGNAPYTYQWNTGATSQTISNLGVGTYTVTVTGSNGCSAVSNDTVASSGGSFAVWLNATPPGCSGAATGSITAMANGGTFPYFYNWSNGGNTQTITNLTAGTYMVTVTDAQGCSSVKTATLVSSSTVMVWLSSTPTSCNNSNDGTATANGMGGLQPYTYQWNTGATGNFIANLSPGTYSVTATDATGCIGSASVTVTAASPFLLNVTSSDATMCGSGNGTATANPNGGTAPYAYQWNNGGNTQMIANLPAGTYFVTVTDNNGCTSTGSTNIGQPADLIVSIQSSPIVCANTFSGSATAFPFGGTAPYFYQWSNGGTSQTINNLAAGTYMVTVFDSGGCMGTSTTTINSAPELTIDAVITNILCYTDATGNIEAEGWGGTSPYTYQWNTGQTTSLISNLTAGSYSVTVNDSAGCSTSATFTVTEPMPIMIDIATNDDACAGSNSGSATATATAGVGPYSFSWSDGQNGQTISNLAAGNYFITVTDANSCTAVGLAIINASPDINVSVSKSNVTCFGGNNGLAMANPIGGTAPFSYQWNTGQNTQIIDNLTAGTYFVTVTDSNGCTATSSVNVTQPPAILINISSTPSVCTGNTNGTATVSANGGTLPYSYQWNTGATTTTISTLAPGTYTVTVTDDNNCTQMATTTILESVNYTIDLATADVICNGESSGSALVSGWGGTPPYTYIWNNGSIDPSQTGLSVGTYMVTVTDAAGCVIVEPVVINEPTVLVASATGTEPGCAGTTGSAMANATGGVPPYAYQWNNFQTTQTISNLTLGTYSVTVLDANFCAQTASVAINSSGSNIMASVQTMNVSCFGGNNGTATATGSNGVAPYTYAWSNGGNTQTISSLSIATYTVTITDGLGCTATNAGTVSQPTQVTINITDNDVSCFGANDGSATASANGGTPGYIYAWSNGGNTQTISNLSAGTYTITVFDSNGCTITGSTEVTQPNDITLNVTTTLAVCGSDNGTASAAASGGNVPYTYAWSNAGSNMTINNLAAGTYTVTVTDNSGCTKVASGTVSGTQVLNVTTASISTSCFAGNDGTVTANGTGGNPPYFYMWTTGATTQTISNLSIGTYTVTLTDANGCTNTSSTTVSQPTNVVLTVNSTDEVCQGSNNGTATASATGGTLGYIYAWSNGASGSMVSNLAAGTYSVTVTDANGCAKVGSTTVNPGGNLSVNATGTNVSCNGGNNGSASATTNGGAMPYTYAWSNGGNTATILNLSVGTYLVTVTDANGCTNSAVATLNAPPAINVTVTSVNTCSGQTNGSATANATGGSGYSYAWSNGGNIETISGLYVGSYSVTVTNLDGCTATSSTSVSTAQGPSCIVVPTTAISSPGASDGALTVNFGSANPTDTYQWNNGATTQTISNLSAGTYFVTVTAANGCTSTCQATLTHPSACDNITDAGTICCDQTLCGPGSNAAPLTETSPAMGGSGVIEYLWMKSSIGGAINSNTWMIIPGGTGPNYDPGLLYETTYFVRCVRRNPCVNYLETNYITITIDNQSTAIIQGDDFVCQGEANDYTAAFAGTGATYQWTFSGGASVPSSNNISVANVIWNSLGSKTVTLTVTNNGCTTTNTMIVFVSNSPVFCGSPLQIVVTSFSQDVVSVDWNMEMPATEDYLFTVERSGDGVEFVALEEMTEGLNNTSNFQHYDQSPKKGRSFYRVKLEDMNGNLVYSNVEEIKLTANLDLAFLYPNPAGDFMYLEILDDLDAEEITIELIAPNGIIIDNIPMETGAVRTRVDLSNYPTGVYFLVLNYNGNRQKTMRIVKL
ncbi:MAG: hypothetical protein ACI9XO_003200 [Paraglaciecola sp.]|jgi:hypothetical protein